MFYKGENRRTLGPEDFYPEDNKKGGPPKNGALRRVSFWGGNSQRIRSNRRRSSSGEYVDMFSRKTAV